MDINSHAWIYGEHGVNGELVNQIVWPEREFEHVHVHMKSFVAMKLEWKKNIAISQCVIVAQVSLQLLLRADKNLVFL